MTPTIEACSYAAWPAEEVAETGGWRLRFTHGITRRGNSVWTNAGTEDLPLDARIRGAEAFYRERGLPATFQLSPLCVPDNLDEELERRGYLVDAAVSVQVAKTVDLAGAPLAGTRVEGRLFEDWFEISGRRGRFASVTEVYRALLMRIGPHALFGLSHVDGVPAAVGLGVLGNGWLGVFSMLTLPEHRRRGAAEATLRGLAGVAHERGIENVYLQVERDNGPALGLYRRLGFTEAYGYHYRVSPLASDR